MASINSTIFDNTDSNPNDNPAENVPNAIQIGRRFIACDVQSGLLLINQQRATERIIYERLMQNENKSLASQTLLFPINCRFA